MQAASVIVDEPLMLGESFPRRGRCGGKTLTVLSLAVGLVVAVTLISSTLVREPTDTMIATQGLRTASRSIFGTAVRRAGMVPSGAKPVASFVVRAAPDIAEVKTEVRGKEGTESFRRFFLNKEGKEISPWHDLPLRTDVPNEFWMVTEIPKMTKPKMEIATKEPSNPIAQDEKKGKLRDYHGPIFWNYGYLPKTWEDPTVEHPDLKCLGDNDPVDVVEIGSKALAQGAISRVKVLGALAMIDDGELDWKIIAISTDDELASQLSDISDVDAKLPGVVSGIREWFRWYKTPDGKPLNGFGYDGAALDKAKTIKIIDETNEAYERLVAGKVESKLWTPK
jgi:inorganic pyrophosphatase